VTISHLIRGESSKVLLVLMAGVFMAALDTAIVGPAIPAIKASFGIGDRSIIWIYNIYILMYMIGMPLMARLSDVYGRRMVYILDIVLFAAGSVIVILTPSFSGLLLGRAVQGFGAGGIFPVAVAFVADAFPPEKMGRVLGAMSSIFGIAYIVGPVMGGFLLPFSWKLLFLVNLPAAAAVIVLSFKALPGTFQPKFKPFDWRGLVVLAAAVTSLTYGVNSIDTQKFVSSLTSDAIWPFLLAFLILAPIFWRIEKGIENPMIRTELFESRQMALAAILALSAGLVQSGTVFIPAMAVASLGMKDYTASLMMMPLVLAMVLGSNMVGRLLDSYGPRTVVIVGGVVLSAGMACLGILASSPWLFLISCLICGIGFSGLAGAPLSYIVLSESPAGEKATSQGAISLYASTGMMIGGALFGAVAASRGGGVAGYQAAYLSISIIALAMGAMGMGLRKKEKFS